MAVTIIGDLDEAQVIWRYVSLDKLICMLDERTLYFSALKSFAHSDPFEGWPPARIMEEMFKVVTQTGPHMSDPARFKEFSNALFKSSVVSCWHANSDESEAMWKLYGDNHKGVAIKSTIGRLERSIETEQTVKIGEVSYIDYRAPTDDNLRQCLRAGLGPLLKRKSYAHECEIRAFFIPKGTTVDNPTFQSASASVEVELLIEEIVISPFAVGPYVAAVKAIARNYGLGDRVRESNLLQGADDVFAFLHEQGAPELT